MTVQAEEHSIANPTRQARPRPICSWLPSPRVAVISNIPAHTRFDAAVAAAYGWSDWANGLLDCAIFNRLLAENLRRTGVAY